ncbi:MAG: RNA polymerase sigma-70 factor [Bacteroidetes bacterium]|nr:RNA polymerase sigma-70 factor [Bacteroidota bacterium]
MLLDERDIIDRLYQGDEGAFTEIFYYYANKLYSFIKKLTRSEEIAEELVQEVFLSLWINREKIAKVENCSSYIFTIAANKTFNYLKSKAIHERYLETMLFNKSESDNNTMESVDFHESQSILGKLINQLPTQKKIIYKLTRESGMSHDEVALQLGISKNTVKNHLVKTLRLLKDNLKSND